MCRMEVYVHRRERAMSVGGHTLEDNDSRWCGLAKTESKQAWVKHEERSGRHPDARYKHQSTIRQGAHLQLRQGALDLGRSRVARRAVGRVAENEK
jgi:hypothetical protein